MLIDGGRLAELAQRLDAARKKKSSYCTAQRDEARVEWQPITKRPSGRLQQLHEYRCDAEDGFGLWHKKVEIPATAHGIAFLAIDPETGDVHCSVCHQGGA